MKSVYFKYSDFLKHIYGEKVYKLPVNIPVSCPNRCMGLKGCSFCGEKGAGFENLSGTLSVYEQLLTNKEYIGKRYKAKKFIAYFQNYTNTFLPLDDFKRFMNEAAVEDVVEIAVSTRPDCINDSYLDVLADIKEKYGINITVELGLQSINPNTLKAVNRGHGLAEYIDAVNTIKKYGFFICTHMMLNLPGDTLADVKEGAKVLSVLGTDFVKLHALYIVKDTLMARQYENGEFSVCSVDEYKERVIEFLRYLKSDIAVERIIGRVPEEDAVFANWNMSWWKIRDEIEAYMSENGIYQGDKFDYLGGKALKVFEK